MTSGPVVADAMLSEPVVFPPDVTVGALRGWFLDDHVHAALVVEGGRLLAVVERGDIDGAAADRPAAPLGRLGVRTVGPGTPVADAAAALTSGRRRLAVVDDQGRLLGLLCRKRSSPGFCSDDDVRARAADPAAGGGRQARSRCG